MLSLYLHFIYIYIFFSDFLIVKCNLQCREQAHFHCCYCSKTVIRKVQIIKHLQVCTKRQVPPTETVETAAIIEPVATSEPIIPSNEEVSFKEPAVAEGVSLPVKFPPVLKNVLQHYNTKQNKKIEDGIRKIVPQNGQLHLDVHGQIIMGNSVHLFIHFYSCHDFSVCYIKIFFLLVLPQ